MQENCLEGFPQKGSRWLPVPLLDIRPETRVKSQHNPAKAMLGLIREACGHDPKQLKEEIRVLYQGAGTLVWIRESFFILRSLS